MHTCPKFSLLVLLAVAKGMQPPSYQPSSTRPISSPTVVPTYASKLLTLEWQGGTPNITGELYDYSYVVSHTFENMGYNRDTKWFLSVDTIPTGFGPPVFNQYIMFAANEPHNRLYDSAPEAQLLHCGPGQFLCEKMDNFFNCFMNVEISKYVLPEKGGSITIISTLVNFVNPTCMVDNNVIYMRYAFHHTLIPSYPCTLIPLYPHTLTLITLAHFHS